MWKNIQSVPTKLELVDVPDGTRYNSVNSDPILKSSFALDSVINFLRFGYFRFFIGLSVIADQTPKVKSAIINAASRSSRDVFFEVA